jgi:hypothetical protein
MALHEEAEILSRATQQRESLKARGDELILLVHRVREMEALIFQRDLKPQHLREESTRKALADILQKHGGKIVSLERLAPVDRTEVMTSFRLRGHGPYDGLFAAIGDLASMGTDISLDTLNLRNDVSGGVGVVFDMTMSLEAEDYAVGGCKPNARYKKLSSESMN